MTGLKTMTMTMAVEEKGGGTLPRRMMMLLAVVALMMVMLAMSVAPAFTHEAPCSGNGSLRLQGTHSDYDPAIDRNGNGAICKYDRFDKDGSLVDTRYKDDHSHQRR